MYKVPNPTGACLAPYTRLPPPCHILYISMNAGDQIESDPFADPSVSGSQHDVAQDATLIVGRNASLTLGTDSLIVLGRFVHS